MQKVHLEPKKATFSRFQPKMCRVFRLGVLVFPEFFVCFFGLVCKPISGRDTPPAGNYCDCLRGWLEDYRHSASEVTRLRKAWIKIHQEFPLIVGQRGFY